MKTEWDNITKIKAENREFKKRIAELENVLKEVKKDLLMRAEQDSDGFKVVNISSSLWITLNDEIKGQNK